MTAVPMAQTEAPTIPSGLRAKEFTPQGWEPMRPCLRFVGQVRRLAVHHPNMVEIGEVEPGRQSLGWIRSEKVVPRCSSSSLWLYGSSLCKLTTSVRKVCVSLWELTASLSEVTRY